MSRFSLEQRWEILKTYFRSKCCVAETARKLRTLYGRKEAPSAPGIRKIINKFRDTGMLVDKKRSMPARPIRTAEKIVAVAESVRENPRTSIRHRAEELNISRSSLRRILHKDLGLLAYKVQLTQELKEEEPAEEEEEAVEEEPVEQATSTTETSKKYIKGGIVRPFRSNDDLLASLKRRREQAALNKQHSKTVHHEAEESAPTEEKAVAPSKSKPSSGGRKRFNSPKKEQALEEINDQEEPTAAAPSRTGRRFNHRS